MDEEKGLKKIKPPKTPKGISSRERCPITADEAFEVYRQLENPSAAKLHKKLLEMGDAPTKTTLERWQRQHNWAQRLNKQPHGNAVVSAAEKTLKTVQSDGKHFDHETLRGLNSRIVNTMVRELEMLKMETPEDFRVMTEVMQEISAQIHHQRGNEMVSGNAAQPKGDVLRLPLAPALRQKQAEG